MIGKAKNIDNRKPKFIIKKNAFYTLLYSNDQRKLAETALPTQSYPKMPIIRQDIEQKVTPTNTAFDILLSLTFFMPLKTGKKFIWQLRAKRILGTAAAALNQLLGTNRISPTGLFKGLSSKVVVMKKITNVTINITMPATPLSAINLSLSIFLTRVRGVQSRAIMRTKKIGFVQNQSRAGSKSGRMSTSILRIEDLNIISYAIPAQLRIYIYQYCQERLRQIPILLRICVSIFHRRSLKNCCVLTNFQLQEVKWIQIEQQLLPIRKQLILQPIPFCQQ